ncbi:MAG: ParA family protein [Bacteroidia bacterium]|nr:ParA family protein [Bacteroidia bacterium]
MSRVISLINHKGGVGKTTTTLNLGKALAMQGRKVLIVDIDPQSNLSVSIGIRNPEVNIYDAICGDKELPVRKLEDNFFIVPADLNLSMADVQLQSGVGGYFKFKKALSPIAQDYEFILVDCPPSLGILTMNALIASNEVLIVVQSEFLSIEGLTTITNLLEEMSSNLGISWKITGFLLTQTNHTVVSKSVSEGLRERFGEHVFNTAIRRNISLVEASGLQQDIFSYAPASHGAKDYLALAKEILTGD